MPPFYDGKNWNIHSDSVVLGPCGTQIRILKSAIFTNLLLPYFLEETTKINNKMNTENQLLQKKRLNFIGSFSLNKINSFYLEAHEKINYYQSIIKLSDRVEEILKGYKQILEFMDLAVFGFTLINFEQIKDDPKIKDHNNFYQKFYNFDNLKGYINDRKKAETYSAELINNYNDLQVKKDRFQNTIADVIKLLEDRRNKIESNINTLLTIWLPALGAFLISFIWYAKLKWFN